jgi:uncharacterized membrane protein YphA (DoxX/SURF4 family)
MTLWMKNLMTVVRIVVGLILVYSGAIKLARPYDLLTTIYQYQAVGPRTGTLLAAVLPFLELMLGVALVCGVLALGASFLASVLFLMFTIGQASALARGISADCGCFGAGEQVGALSLLRTAGLFLCSLLCFGSECRPHRDAVGSRKRRSRCEICGQSHQMHSAPQGVPT